MSGQTERFVRRATLGLWGPARRAAQMELRGAIEDKVYRLRLLGLSETEANARALRDLGSPGAIARELGAVHTLPLALKFALMTGLAGLLSLQAGAQVPTVRASPGSAFQGACDSISTVKPDTLSPQERAWLTQILREHGGPEGAQAWCRSLMARGGERLSVADILSALKSAGVKVDEPAQPGLFYLQFPGREDVQMLDLFSGGEESQNYVHVGTLISSLAWRFPKDLPVRLEGAKNPTLSLGPVQLKLGTESNPVYLADLYTTLVSQELYDLYGKNPFEESLLYVRPALALAFDAPSPRLGLAAPEGDLFVTVHTENAPGKKPRLVAEIQTVEKGQIRQPGLTDDTWKLVSTSDELTRALDRREQAMLVYRLAAPTLRSLKLTPVAATQIERLGSAQR